MRLLKIFYYLLYLFVKYLPPTNTSKNIITISVRLIRSTIGGLLLKNKGNINIEARADFGLGEGIAVGRNSGIGVNCSIRGPLSIGNEVMMGPNVTILTRNHNFESGRKYKSLGSKVKKVTIGNNVWIGCNVIILPGVSIDDNCVVGAGSVVSKSFKKNSLIVGNPAVLKRVI